MLESLPMSDRDRRWRLLRVAPFMLSGLLAALAGGETVEIEGWPEDAQITGVGHDFERDLLLLRVESESFEVVPAGACAVDMEVTIYRRSLAEAN